MEPIAIFAMYTIFILRKYLMPKWFDYKLTGNASENIKILNKVMASTEKLFFIVNSISILLIIRLFFPEQHAEHTTAFIFASVSISYGLLTLTDILMGSKPAYKNLVWAIIFSTLALMCI